MGNSSTNAWPLLLLAGSSETELVSRGAFQELDAISLLSPHTKLASRPPSLDSIQSTLENAYRTSWYGRPGTAFVDLPADLIKGTMPNSSELPRLLPLPDPPKPGADPAKLFKITTLLKSAASPLVVIGKGAAYSQSEELIRALIDQTHIPFLPTPMGKGVLPDSHPLNTASARSTALKNADVVLILGARLNWILHFGSPPKWRPNVKFIHIDISAEEIGKNAPRSAELGVVGDISVVVPQLTTALKGWSYSSRPVDQSSRSFTHLLQTAKTKNKAAAAAKLDSAPSGGPMKIATALSVIERTLHRLSPPSQGNIVYISEGANTMDISRSTFPLAHPRLRLDAGTHATMGVGMGYAIAAHAAYNSSAGEARSGPSEERKKIVCIEGDSAFGFSAMEVETMSRCGMDVLVFVVNNGGVYQGDADDRDEWEGLREQNPGGDAKGLRSTSLGFETRYDMIAEAVGGKGFFVRTVEELERATEEGFKEGRVCVVNVMVESGKRGKLEFGWQAEGGKKDGNGTSKL